MQHAIEQSGDALDKALYLISALVSSNHDGQHQFHSQNGVSVIRSLLSEELSARQHRKVLNLITDLTDVDGEVEVSSRPASHPSNFHPEFCSHTGSGKDATCKTLKRL